MTSGGLEDGVPVRVQTDEEFQHTVATKDVLAADEALWASLEQFLGKDPVAAWVLIEVTHQPRPKTDAEGNPTGEWELISSGTWKRDPEVPSPERKLVIAAELPDDDGEEEVVELE